MSARQFKENKLLIATKNKGKQREIENLLSGRDIKIISLDKFNLPTPEETGSTFIDNAKLKASYYGEQIGIAALADDSGLLVDDLDGMPGVFSARWASEAGDFSGAMIRIEEMLKKRGKSTSNAGFVCALALYWPDGHVESFEETVGGNISFPPRGKDGFGYDPIFTPTGYDQTFAEIGKELKIRISHRTKAFQQLVKHCFNERD
jgi:XTP/dITP diphosphohydrolase